MFQQYSAPSASRTDRLGNAARLALCELEMGVGDPAAAFDALSEYADTLAQEQMYPQLVECAQQMCTLARENSLERQEAVGLIRLGSAYERLAQPETARECYARSLELARALYGREQTEISRDDLAVACFRLGFIDYISRGETERVYEALGLWNALHDDTGKYEYRSRAAAAENLLATPVEPEAAPETEPAPEPETAPDESPEVSPARDKRRLAFIIIAALLTAAAVIELALLITALGTI